MINARGGMIREKSQATILFEQKIGIERKTYHIALMRNHRARFVRITESGYENGRRTAIVIPFGGLADIARVLTTMIQTDAEAPACADGTPFDPGRPDPRIPG